MGSTLPGGYSTVIIKPSLPGRFVRSFDMSSVTLASCATSEADIRHAIAKITFVNLTNLSFRLTDAIFNAPGVLVGTSELRVVMHEFLFGAQPIFDVVPALPATSFVQTEGELGNLVVCRGQVIAGVASLTPLASDVRAHDVSFVHDSVTSLVFLSVFYAATPGAAE